MLIGLCIGLVAGIVGALILSRIRVFGVLRVDTSDPDDRPYLFLVLTRDVSTVSKKKYVTFRVSTENYISQK